MKEVFQILIEGTGTNKVFTSYLFYNSFLPQLHYYFLTHKDKDLIINFSEINKISPLVIPNLLNVGAILKDYFKNPCRLIFPWNQKLISYLKDIRFISLNENLNLFKLNEDVVKIIETRKIVSESCYTTEILYGKNKSDIYNNHYKEYNKKLYDILNDNKVEVNYELEKEVDNIIKMLVELCHNGANHSNSYCFTTFQLNKQNKFEISVSDCGIGFYKSFENKIKNKEYKLKFIQNEELLNLDDNKKNLYSIIEAIYFRYDKSDAPYESKYGLFDIFNSILKKRKGVIRFHTENSQIILTEYIYNKLINDNNQSNTINNNKIISLIKSKNDNIKIFEHKYKGVHIELEIPLNINKQ